MNIDRSNRAILWLLGGIVWFVVNIRVAAGIGSMTERAFDGLVGGVVLLVSIYYGCRFFGLLNDVDDRDLDSR
ncbi:hypothetical protein ACLG6S_00755 [Thermodesulfobacteriota bacterium B35]